jgi:hypothetical protein
LYLGKAFRSVLVGQDENFQLGQLLDTRNESFVGCKISDMEKHETVIGLRVEFKDPFVYIDERDVVECGVLGLHVVFGPEEFDEARGAKHDIRYQLRCTINKMYCTN